MLSLALLNLQHLFFRRNMNEHDPDVNHSNFGSDNICWTFLNTNNFVMPF